MLHYRQIWCFIIDKFGVTLSTNSTGKQVHAIGRQCQNQTSNTRVDCFHLSPRDIFLIFLKCRSLNVIRKVRIDVQLFCDHAEVNVHFPFLVSLTKTDKKGLGFKQHCIDDIRNCIEKYDSVYLFSVFNMRNTLLKEVRGEWRDSRFFFGKNRIMKLGLGTSDSTEVEKDLHKLSKRITNQCGLLFTSRDKAAVQKWFDEYSAIDYARSGFRATETVTIEEGPQDEFCHSIEPHIRKLGLPTKLDKGIVVLYKDYTVCKKGQILTPEQAKVLKLIAKPIATFRLTINCLWNKTTGFEALTEGDDDTGADSGRGDDDEEDDDEEMEAESDENAD